MLLAGGESVMKAWISMVVLLLSVLWALPARAQNTPVQGQVGLGSSLSFTLGRLQPEQRRLHGEVHVFAELGVSWRPLDRNGPGGINRFVSGVVGTLRWRHGAELEGAARLGIANTFDTAGAGMLTAARVSAEGGVSWRPRDGRSGALGGLEGRLMWLHVDNRFRSGGGGETLDVGVEVGGVLIGFADIAFTTLDDGGPPPVGVE